MPRGRTTRMSLFSPGGEQPYNYADGTWIEPEAFAYPHGGFTRRCYAVCPDGKKRVCKISVADTFFTVPARVTYGCEYKRGYVTVNKQNYVYGMEFVETGQ